MYLKLWCVQERENLFPLVQETDCLEKCVSLFCIILFYFLCQRLVRSSYNLDAGFILGVNNCASMAGYICVTDPNVIFRVLLPNISKFKTLRSEFLNCVH